MLVVGIAGGSGAGKTTVVRKIIERLPKGSVALLSQDNYYIDNSHLPMKERHQLNFDHPSAIEFDLLIEHLADLKAGKTINMPVYSYFTYVRLDDVIPIQPCEVIIVDGILIMTNERLRDLLDIKVFVDADADDRLMRRLQRDVLDRGYSVEGVLHKYEYTVKPMHIQFIEPTKRYADIIVPQGGNNEVAIDVLASMIRLKENLVD